MLFGSALIRSKVFHTSTQPLRRAFPRGFVVSLRMGEQVFSTKGLIWCPFLFHALRTLGISLTVVIFQHHCRICGCRFRFQSPRASWSDYSSQQNALIPEWRQVCCVFPRFSSVVPAVMSSTSSSDDIMCCRLGGGCVFLRLMRDSWWRPQLRFGDFLVEEGLSFLLWEDAKLMLPICSRDFGQQKHKYSSDPQTSSKLCSGRPNVVN